ncbi:MAG: hypothetical protein H6581_08450 [Bacteroidia bacterium]|nr:hypothetical protein [Bacteroidia bacterium]
MISTYMKTLLLSPLLLVPIVLMAIHADVGNLATRAVSTDAQEAKEAIAQLRSLGPEGIELFIAAHEEEFLQKDRNQILSLHQTLDQIAGQKDSWYAQLYWYTDLTQAKLAAQKEQKPILSLRMLGNLTDDLSCANSRMFRTVLYANSAVSKFMRENYILHWSSERPVPVVTIDYGDGRVLKRTITGNSIHYILDPNGKPLDAIPGMNTPESFLAQLQKGEALYQQVKGLEATEAREIILAFHQTEREKIAAFARENEISVEPAPDPLASALSAERFTMSKARVEMPILRQVADLNPVKIPSMGRQLDGNVPLDPWGLIEGENGKELALWQKLAADYGLKMKIDDNSRALFKAKDPQKYANEIALEQDIKVIEEGTPVETVRNEIMQHLRLHDWFIANDYQDALGQLNTSVYREIFLTPRSDVWLGLVPDNVFPALDEGGIEMN